MKLSRCDLLQSLLRLDFLIEMGFEDIGLKALLGLNAEGRFVVL